MAQQSIAANAQAAQQHAANAQALANAGDLQGARAELDAAIAALQAVANELIDISVIGIRDGDPAGKGGFFGGQDGLMTANNLTVEAAAAEAAAASSTSSDSESDNGDN